MLAAPIQAGQTGRPRVHHSYIFVTVSEICYSNKRICQQRLCYYFKKPLKDQILRSFNVKLPEDVSRHDVLYSPLDSEQIEGRPTNLFHGPLNPDYQVEDYNLAHSKLAVHITNAESNLSRVNEKTMKNGKSRRNRRSTPIIDEEKLEPKTDRNTPDVEAKRPKSPIRKNHEKGENMIISKEGHQVSGLWQILAHKFCTSLVF